MIGFLLKTIKPVTDKIVPGSKWDLLVFIASLLLVAFAVFYYFGNMVETIIACIFSFLGLNILQGSNEKRAEQAQAVADEHAGKAAELHKEADKIHEESLELASDITPTPKKEGFKPTIIKSE